MPPKRSPLVAELSMEELLQEWQERLEKQRRQVAEAEEQMQQRCRECEAALEKREKDLAEREQQVEAKEEKLSGMLGKGEDVIEISAGGQVHAVSRGTLCLVEGSLLASMFSGRWDDKMQRDGAGRPFLDVDPQVFEAILSYLRLQRVAAPGEKVDGPEVEPRKAGALRAMMRYYGLAAGAAVITNFSDAHPATPLVQMNCADPRGYVVRFSRPYRLQAVWVGCEVQPSTTVRLIIGTSPTDILLEVPIEPGTCAADPELTHVAQGLDLVLQPPECLIMLKREGPSGSYAFKYRNKDTAEHTRGIFRVQGKHFKPPLHDLEKHMCMAIEGCEV